MAGSPNFGDLQKNQPTEQVASGGPVGVAPAYYAKWAAQLLDNGYEPIPLLPRSKKPAPKGWPTMVIDSAQVDAWQRSHGHCGIGLRTGHLVGIDIDHLDPDMSHHLASRAVEMFGPTLVRVGRWPKQLLIYRTLTPIAKLSLPHLEILGRGQQFVAHGIHPDTGLPYDWVTGDGPCDVPFDRLPLVDETGLQAFLAEAAAMTADRVDARRPRRDGHRDAVLHCGPARNAAGLVINGRDGWLSRIAFHTLHDALERQEAPDPERLAARVWARFAATTELDRPRQDSRRAWAPADAALKVADKLDLLRRDRLPRRDMPDIQPEDPGDFLPPDVARARLQNAIDNALASAMAWWSGDRANPAPALGIRATVGLGKSAVSRERIAAWQGRMKDQGLPHRVLVVTPSHALAEEAAATWTMTVDGPVAVHRGYEAMDPITKEPMCRDHEMVQLALHEDLGVGRSVCYTSATWHCPHYEGCLKQANRRAVAAADVVLAPYDILFTGIGAGDVPFGLLVVDEGCWQRADGMTRGPPVEKIARVGLSAGHGPDDPIDATAMADLAVLRVKAQAAIVSNGPGAVEAAALRAVGLTVEDCGLAADLEERCIRDAPIYGGMKSRARRQAKEIVKRNEIARRLAAIWRAMANVLGNSHPGVGLLRITPPDPETDLHGLVLHDHLHLAAPFRSLPILHLDATLRLDLARLILPGLEVTRIEAQQPNLKLTLVTGRFGKSSLCSLPSLPLDEQLRRQNRLRDVVDHVRWQARRIGAGGILVVTYKAIEDAFAGINGVRTAHFNAIAGLDQYRDVRLLIVVGRPLPSSDALTPLTASFFHTLPDGLYRPEWRAVRLKTGGTANLRVVAHADPQAELLRAAICDDEVVQAIGRGRGVNRSVGNPLEVQVLADVALPTIHDRVMPWEMMVPDVFQRMLLAGLAVDSPADAALIHVEMFDTADMAESIFRRSGFNRQNPIESTYREMSLKSARYRRGGKGRSWQRVWWVEGGPADARQKLEAVLGAIDGWESG